MMTKKENARSKASDAVDTSAVDILHSLYPHLNIDGIKIQAGTQVYDLAVYLAEHGSIEPIEALMELGIYRLAPRIHDLRDMGFDIATEKVSHNGKTYAKYTIEGDQ